MTWMILVAFLAVAAYLLLLACPLLHFVLHRGHRPDGHGGRGRHEPGPRGPETPSASRLTISIVYELPRSGFWRIVGLVLARAYSRWCLRRMCRDTKHVLEAPSTVRA